VNVNPSFSDGLTGWTVFGDNPLSVSGSPPAWCPTPQCAVLGRSPTDWTGSLQLNGVNIIRAAPGYSYQGGGFVWSEAGGNVNVEITFWDANGTQIMGSRSVATHLPAMDWTWCFATQIAPAGTAWTQLRIWAPNAASYPLFVTLAGIAGGNRPPRPSTYEVVAPPITPNNGVVAIPGSTLNVTLDRPSDVLATIQFDTQMNMDHDWYGSLMWGANEQQPTCTLLRRNSGSGAILRMLLMAQVRLPAVPAGAHTFSLRSNWLGTTGQMTLRDMRITLLVVPLT
jgi:hypothetical protein